MFFEPEDANGGKADIHECIWFSNTSGYRMDFFFIQRLLLSDEKNKQLLLLSSEQHVTCNIQLSAWYDYDIICMPVCAIACLVNYSNVDS